MSQKGCGDFYKSCSKCGATHGMGIEDMTTGVITPIDVCRDCLFKGCKIVHPQEKIILDDSIMDTE